MPTPATPDSVRNRVVGLARQGIPPFDICKALGNTVKLGRIYHLLSEARAAGVDIPCFEAGRRRRTRHNEKVAVPLERRHMDMLDTAAAARGISVTLLVRRLVIATLDGQLIGAVLDDRGRS